MERWTQPLAIITTVQPFLLFWTMAIAFFLTLTLVAVISKGRTWKEIGAIFALSYLVVVLLTLFTSEVIVGVDILRFESVTYNPYQTVE